MPDERIFRRGKAAHRIQVSKSLTKSSKFQTSKLSRNFSGIAQYSNAWSRKTFEQPINLRMVAIHNYNYIGTVTGPM